MLENAKKIQTGGITSFNHLWIVLFPLVVAFGIFFSVAAAANSPIEKDVSF